MSGRKTTWGGPWPAALGTPGTVPGVADGAGLTAQGHGRTVPRRAPERVCHRGGHRLLLHGLEQLNKPLLVCEKSSPRLPGGIAPLLSGQRSRSVARAAAGRCESSGMRDTKPQAQAGFRGRKFTLEPRLLGCHHLRFQVCPKKSGARVWRVTGTCEPLWVNSHFKKLASTQEATPKSHTAPRAGRLSPGAVHSPLLPSHAWLP